MSKLAHSNDETMAQIEARDDDRDIDAEANAFAMELLMPEHLLRADLAKMGGIDIEDEPKVEKLARRYKVTRAVMILRLGQLLNVIEREHLDAANNGRI